MHPSVLRQLKNGVRSYFLFNNLGSIVALADANGNLQQRFDYGYFGEQKTSNPTVDSHLRYAGGYFDASLGLMKFGERFYDAKNAIWTQRDTIAGNIVDPASLNRYAYVSGDPINYVDPSGGMWS